MRESLPRDSSVSFGVPPLELLLLLRDRQHVRVQGSLLGICILLISVTCAEIIGEA
jgi:hypothetical protein